MADFVMPALGAEMQAGTLLEWRVRTGDHVRRGDVIAVIETDKAAIEVEVFETGVIEALLVQPGAHVPVGTPLARVHADTAPSRPSPATAAQPAAPTSAPSSAIAPAVPTAIPTAEARVRVSPLARRVAEQLGVDVSTVRGSGSRGAITRADIEAAATALPFRGTPGAPAPAPAEATERGLRMRRAIAAAVERANREIPHYYLEETVDLSPALNWLGEENRQRPARDRVLPVALFVRAVALACLEVPALNGFWHDGRFEGSERAHVGIAISLRDAGLVAPAILDADRKRAPEIMASLLDVGRRARRGGLRGSELSSATITVTSLGDAGVERVYGVIYPPQVALVGFGAVRERPWAERGMLDVRPSVVVTLAADHRASDGYQGGRFLRRIAHLLQDPAAL